MHWEVETRSDLEMKSILSIKKALKNSKIFRIS